MSTPWNFPAELAAPNGSQCLRYGTLREFGQGSPLNGDCFWLDANGATVQLPGSYGGPALWDAKGHRIVLPLWQPSLLGSTYQRLAVLDTLLRKLVVFRRSFLVLHIQTFDGLNITGVDSPVSYPAEVLFDAGAEAIQQVIAL